MPRSVFDSARRLLVVLLLLFAIRPAATGQAGPWAWVLDAGHLNRKVATDAAGNTYVIGEYTGPMQLGTTQLTGGGAYVAKLSAAGQWQWAHPIANAWSADIGLDAAGNVYVGGIAFGTATLGAFTVHDLSGGTGSLFFAKLSAAGQWAWAVQPTGAIFAQGAIDNLFTVAPDGHLYCVATLQGPATFGLTTVAPEGPAGAVIAALDATGQWQWARVLTGAPGTYCATYLGAVTTDRAGRVYVAGAYGFADLVVGPFTLPGRQTHDLFLGRLSAAGDWEWVSTAEMGLNPGTPNVNNNLTIDPVSGAVFVTASFTADARFGTITLHDPTPPGSVSFGTVVVARADSAGHWQWAVPLASAASWNVVTGLTPGPNQSLVVSLCYRYAGAQFGSIALPVPANADINTALLTVGRDGTARAATIIPAVFNEDVATLPSGDVVVTGLVYGDQPMFSTQPFPDPADTDPYNAYVARLTAAALAVPAGVADAVFNVFPNPATTTVRLQIPAGAAPAVFLTDLSGRIVRTYPLAPQQTTRILDVAGLARGVYTVRVGSATRRLVVD